MMKLKIKKEIEDNLKEIEELKNDNFYYEEELQKKEKEIDNMKKKAPKGNDEDYVKLNDDMDDLERRYDQLIEKHNELKKKMIEI